MGASVGLGVAVGALARNVPAAIALRVPWSGARPESCTMERAAECAFDDLPLAFESLLRFGLALVAASAALALVGLAAAIAGGVRIRRASRGDPPDPGRHGAVDLAGLTLLAGGIALVVPGLWLVASFAAFILR